MNVWFVFRIRRTLPYLTLLCRLKSASHVFWSCFPAENHTWHTKPYSAMAGKSRSAKEYIYVWLVIHYLDFDSVTLYYVCSLQLEIVN